MIREIEQYSDAQLNEIAREVQDKINAIKVQVAHAKSRAAAYGEYSDPDWFVKASTALRYAGAEHQQIQGEYRRRRKARAEQRAIDEYGAFRMAARHTLTQEQFVEIELRARLIMETQRELQTGEAA